MSSDVVLSAALRSNLLSLQNTQRSIDTTQFRLATGLKVNSALDNPQSFFTAQSLSNRASDLQRLLDGIALSIRTIEEADAGVTALTTLIDQAQSVAESAKSEASAAEGFAQIRSTEDLSALDDLVADSSGAIATGDDFVITVRRDGATANLSSGDLTITSGDTIYDVAGTINSNTTINPYVRASVDSGGRLKIESLEEGAIIRIGEGTNALGSDGYTFLGLDNLVGTEALQTGSGSTRQGGTAIAGRTLKSAVSAGTTVDSKYLASDLLTNAAGGAGYIAAGDTVEFRLVIDGTSSGDLVVDATETVQELVDEINGSSVNDLVTASFNTDTGRIELAFADSVGTAELQIESRTAADVTNFVFGTGASDLTAASVINADNSERFTFVGSSADLAQYQDDFNEIRDQIDGLVEDANFRGVNLLSGDNLETFFNESRSNSLTTQGTDFSALGLGLEEADFSNIGGIQLSIDATLAALDSVRNFGQSISNDLAILQNRRDFTESTINTLKSGAEDLTVADQNEEGANLLALQTRQQLGVTSLALAAQSQQSVLRLF